MPFAEAVVSPTPSLSLRERVKGRAICGTSKLVP